MGYYCSIFKILTKFESLNHYITFSGLKARNLKKGMFFQPHPYVKLRIGPDAQNILSPISSQISSGFVTIPTQQNPLQAFPHHGQSRRTQVLENTVDPTWDHEVCISRSFNIRRIIIISLLVVLNKSNRSLIFLLFRSLPLLGFRVMY